jgi:predicted TIM-barrel fold metal-dependent hydrolase
MSYYGPKTPSSVKVNRFDNRYMLDMMALYPEVFVGTAVIDPAAADVEKQMRGMGAKRVRAFRIYPALLQQPSEKWLQPEGYGKMFAVGAKTNQAMSCLINPADLVELDRMCRKFPDTPVIIDHLCRIGADGEVRERDVEALCKMADHQRVLVKVGAFYALGKKKAPYTDLGPMIQNVVKAYGAKRCMWETDCPFQVQGGHTYQDSVDLIAKRLDFLTADDREWLLRKTAESFFFMK